MNEIAKRNTTALSTDMLSRIKTGIAESRASTIIAGGKPLLRMLKDAKWVFGQKDDPVQEGSSWAINPLTLAHGWVAWTNHEGNTKNSMVGEVMVPVHEPKPPRPPAAEGGWPFNEQRIFELACIDGDDAGTEVLYKTSSYGGMRAVDDLLADLQDQLNANPGFPCPVVQLNTDSYQHQKYGKIYNPVFNIVDWASMDGQLQNGEEEAAPPAPPPPTPIRGRKPVAAPKAPVEPEATARRRPVRR
jgi:hypothetical protein